MKTTDGFDIKFIFLAYVPPYIVGKTIALETEVLNTQNKMTDYLLRIFDASINVCKTEINFISDGNQKNIVRSELLELMSNSIISIKEKNAKNLAEKLHLETDERSGTGLFVIIEGVKSNNTRIVLIRFGGDEGLYRHGSKKLDIEYNDEIFSKKHSRNKITVFQDILSEKSFWYGHASDKQVSPGTLRTISYYWIEDFLNAQTSITSAQGTMQFSKIINTVLTKTKNITEQEQIVSAIANLKSKPNYQMSISSFCSTYLNEDLTKQIKKDVGEDFFNSVFTIDSEEYKKAFGKTFLSLHNGITAFIPTNTYDKYVSEKPNNDGSKDITITGKLAFKQFNKTKKEKVSKQ